MLATDFLMYYPAKTYKNKPWALCGSGRGFYRAIKDFGLSAQVDSFGGTGTVLSFLPHFEEVAFGTICNTEASLQEGDTFFGTKIPNNPQDPKAFAGQSSAPLVVEFAKAGAGNTCPAPSIVPAPVQCPGDSAATCSDRNFLKGLKPFGAAGGDLELCWSPPVEDAQGGCDLALQFKAQGKRWLGLGFGTQMVGSKALVGGDWYTMGGKSASLVVKDASNAPHTLKSSQLATDAAGNSVWNLVLRLNSAASCTTKSSILLAVGSSPTLGYHDVATALEVDWAGRGLTASPVTGAPTTERPTMRTTTPSPNTPSPTMPGPATPTSSGSSGAPTTEIPTTSNGPTSPTTATQLPAPAAAGGDSTTPVAVIAGASAAAVVAVALALGVVIMLRRSRTAEPGAKSGVMAARPDNLI